ncbi:MAG: OsmC family protein [Holophaga sp.]|nr:OsmC family protein [Holophaga sp.]
MSHTFPLILNWSGTTLDSTYSRNAEVANPNHLTIPVSSAPAYAGDPTRWNPEDLLASALATCHLLTFLALASKARIEIKAYEDHAEATLETIDKISRIGEIRLRPIIRVARGTSSAKVVELFQKAHKYCIIANSVTCRVVMEPKVIEG